MKNLFFLLFFLVNLVNLSAQYQVFETRGCGYVNLTTNCVNCIECWNGDTYGDKLVFAPSEHTVVITNLSDMSQYVLKHTVNYVWSNPVIGFSVSKACAGEKGTLTVDSPNASKYLWSNGATTSSISVPKGIYYATVTDANGCMSSGYQTLSEFPMSQAPTVMPSINADGTVTLTSNTLSGNMWSNGMTTQSITPTELKIYSLRVKDSNGCYSSTSCHFPAGKMVVEVEKIVEVPNDTCIGSQMPLSCPLVASFAHEVNSKKVSFKNTSSGEGMTQLWMFGDGTSSTEAHPMKDYLSDGSYEVKLFVFKGAETSQFVGKVFVNTKTGNTGGGGTGTATCPPMVSFMYTINDKEVSFKNTSSGDGLLSYLWDFGDNTSSTEKNPTHKYAQYKDYKVTLYVNTNNGLISVSQIVSVVNQAYLSGAVCDSTLIKASNGMKNGEAILPSQISSQTKLIFEHPTAVIHKWEPTGGIFDATLVKTAIGRHHFYVTYTVDNKRLCSVFDYEILGGGITDTDDIESRSREDKGQDINVYPNPTSGPVEIDLSDLPSGGYMINVISTSSGQQVAKKIIKQ